MTDTLASLAKPIAEPALADKKQREKKRKGLEPSTKKETKHNKKARATLTGDQKEEELNPPEETNNGSCLICGEPDNGDDQFLLCDAPGLAEHGCHLACSSLSSVPEGDWFCLSHTHCQRRGRSGRASSGGHGSAGAAGGRGTNTSTPPPPPPSQAPVSLPQTNVAVLPPTDEAKEDAAVARALRMQAPALQMAFRSLEFLGQAACQKTGVSAPAAGAAARPSEILTDAHAEFIGILKAHPGLEGLAWLDFSTITTVEMEAWITEAGGLKFGPQKALDRLHLSAKVENAKR